MNAIGMTVWAARDHDVLTALGVRFCIRKGMRGDLLTYSVTSNQARVWWYADDGRWLLSVPADLLSSNQLTDIDEMVED